MGKRHCRPTCQRYYVIMLLMYRDAWRLVSCAAKNVAIRIASRVSGIAEEQPLLCEKISECLSSKSRRIAALKVVLH